MSMSEESNPRTLYVGNLDVSVSEDLLCALFSQIGQVKGCKIIREAGNDPYAFVEFTNHQCAATALDAMNKRVFLNKEMKVNWATSSGNQSKFDISHHYHIFVDDLSPEIETQALLDAFNPFGEISNCRIVRDPQKTKSKGYAVVSFVKKSDAEAAFDAMNGQWLGSLSIRTKPSTRKPLPPRTERTNYDANKPYEKHCDQENINFQNMQSCNALGKQGTSSVAMKKSDVFNSHVMADQTFDDLFARVKPVPEKLKQNFGQLCAKYIFTIEDGKEVLRDLPYSGHELPSLLDLCTQDLENIQIQKKTGLWNNYEDSHELKELEKSLQALCSIFLLKIEELKVSE